MMVDSDFDFNVRADLGDADNGDRQGRDNNAEEDEDDEKDTSGDLDYHEENDEAALRAALHFYVGEICSAETEGNPMTGAAVSTLAEVR